MTEPTLFEPEHAAAEVLAKPGQRLAFTGGGRHWHGTLTRTSTRPDGSPRLHVDVDAGNGYGINSVAYRTGPHFRLTEQGEQCPDCGKPDSGAPLRSRP
jgi:hypothetical protein